MDKKQHKKWLKERNAAVASLDVNKFKAFYNKWLALGVYTFSLPDDDIIVKISMYKSAVGITSIPKATKKKAVEWLLNNGFSLGV